jgi:hypothetical protein
MRGARRLLALLLLAAGCAEAVKVKLSPYSTECINEVAAAGDLVCVPARASPTHALCLNNRSTER